MSPQKSSDYKETAVHYYLVEDKTQEEVCKIFQCSRRSLMRWVEKYKQIIIDNASTHRNPKVKEIINKDNNLLYGVPYQHFTNSIENYFSMLKSRLQKLDGLSYEELKRNIGNTIKTIPKEKYRNILKGAYERPEKYISKKNKTRKIKKNYL